MWLHCDCFSSFVPLRSDQNFHILFNTVASHLPSSITVHHLYIPCTGIQNILISILLITKLTEIPSILLSLISSITTF